MAKLEYLSVSGRDNVRKAVWAKFDGHCVYCCAPIELDKFHIEHEIPISKGGPNTYSNIFPACISCNCRKGDKRPEQVGFTNHWRLYYFDSGKLRPQRKQADE